MSEATLTRRGARRGPVGRAVLGTGRLWLGAIALVALRMVADLARTLGAWSEHGPAWAELVAWIVLLVAVGALIAAIRALGERLPNRMLLGFAAAAGLAIALDVVSHWGQPDLASRLTVAVSATTSLLLIATTRPGREVVTLAVAATVGVAIGSILSSGLAAGAIATPSAADLVALAQMLVPVVVFVSVVTAFRGFVQVELDRSLVQGTVAAPRLAVASRAPRRSSPVRRGAWASAGMIVIAAIARAAATGRLT